MLQIQHIHGQAALLTLLGLVTLKHFLADFVFQTNAMARSKESPTGWFKALALHTLIHASMLLAIIALVSIKLWWLSLVDLLVHACIDRSKTLISQRMKVSPADAQFWWLLGFDQFLHQITNIFLVFLIVDLQP